MHLSTCIFVYLTHLTFVFHISHSSPTVSHSETTSYLSHMWLRTLYLTFYGYLEHDMVKLSCLLLKSIVEPYNKSHYMYLCMHHTSHVSFSRLTQISLHHLSQKSHHISHICIIERRIWRFTAILYMIWSSYRVYD